MGLVRDRRARTAAKRMLGSRGSIVRHRRDGTPVVEVGGRELLYRHRHGETYFRLQLLCASCKRHHLTWRGARITSAEQLDTIDPPPEICHACAADQAALREDPLLLRTKFIHRKL